MQNTNETEFEKELKKKNKDLKTSINNIFEAENRLKNSRVGLTGSLTGLIQSNLEILKRLENK